MANQPETNNLCSELVSVLYEDRFNRTRSASANLEQISPSHAVLLSDECPEPGKPIAFYAQDQEFYGTVESLELDDTLGCFTRVRLDARSRWNGRVFVPEHFLALCSLGEAAEPDAESPVAPCPKVSTLEQR